MNHTLKRNERVFIIALVIWLLLQLSRFIALVLIQEINVGVETPAWMFPAYLDMFAAILALPLTVMVWKARGFLTWSFIVIYLAISIIDHIGNFVTTDLVGPPSIVPEGSNPILFPAIMTVFDTIFIIMLFVPKYRDIFFKITE
ncbi:MAG: hypothetical protein ABJO36_01345 [Litorimonas sp.]